MKKAIPFLLVLCMLVSIVVLPANADGTNDGMVADLDFNTFETADLKDYNLSNGVLIKLARSGDWLPSDAEIVEDDGQNVLHIPRTDGALRSFQIGNTYNAESGNLAELMEEPAIFSMTFKFTQLDVGASFYVQMLTKNASNESAFNSVRIVGDSNGNGTITLDCDNSWNGYAGGTITKDIYHTISVVYYRSARLQSFFLDGELLQTVHQYRHGAITDAPSTAIARFKVMIPKITTENNTVNLYIKRVSCYNSRIPTELSAETAKSYAKSFFTNYVTGSDLSGSCFHSYLTNIDSAVTLSEIKNAFNTAMNAVVFAFNFESVTTFKNITTSNGAKAAFSTGTGWCSSDCTISGGEFHYVSTDNALHGFDMNTLGALTGNSVVLFMNVRIDEITEGQFFKVAMVNQDNNWYFAVMIMADGGIYVDCKTTNNANVSKDISIKAGNISDTEYHNISLVMNLTENRQELYLDGVLGAVVSGFHTGATSKTPTSIVRFKFESPAVAGNCKVSFKSISVYNAETPLEIAANPYAVSLVDGAQVRLNEPTGLRFIGRVSNTWIDSAKTAYGDENVKFGIIITPNDYLTGAKAKEFTMTSLDADNTISGVKYEKVEAVALYNTDTAEDNGFYEFTAVLSRIQAENLNRSFAAIAYVEIVSDGNTEIIYSDFDSLKNVRTAADVAAAALNDLNATQTEKYAYLVAENSYSPYTEAQRVVLSDLAGRS